VSRPGLVRRLTVATWAAAACAGCTEANVVLGDGHASSCGDASDPACAPFGNVTVVSELSADGGEAEDPTLTSGMLEIYFLSTRDGGPGHGDVWYATRASTAQTWGAPSLVGAVNTAYHEKGPAISQDGLSLWVGSDRRSSGTGVIEIFVSTRSGGTASWSAPVLVPELESTQDQIPYPPGEQSLVMPLSRRATATQPYEIFTASRPSETSPWSPPVRLDSIDTSGLNVDGFLSQDGLTLYFSSDRLSGSQDLFVAERTDVSAPFAAPVALAALNTPAYEEAGPWVSPDGHEIYFESDRTGTKQIYHAVR
jgi:hypothetical protein